ncbi:hypothetical protein CRE_30133 [Caenorhabditis remanei]|uniref:Uncharacterized protein n=1 Tax=Caenorhabditis remanei TaxID=31234 RepID=E3N635_CAERE|nr:hypothetical protein CRE_30133 [Caenorhabditis remanei]
MHTILEKNGLAVFDLTKGEIIHRKLLPSKGHAIGFLSGKTSDDLFVIHGSSQNSNTSITKVNPRRRETCQTGAHKYHQLLSPCTNMIYLKRATRQEKVNKFGDHFVAIRDRNRRRLKRRVKDNQKHYDMQEERDHAQTQMIVVGKSVRLSDFNKKGLIGKGTYGIICQYESKRSGRKMSDLSQKFERDGFVVIENVFNDHKIEEMKGAIAEFVDDMNLTEHVFSTYDEEKEGVVDKNGELTVPKDKNLHKIGHGQHFLDPTFKKPSSKYDIRSLKSFKVCMYIFKQQKIGRAVTDHVDSTFLRVDSIDHLTGVWIAIDEASVENGCLSFIPGSHIYILPRT